MTPQERLAEIDSAISHLVQQIANGTEQSYEFRGKVIQRANFAATLRELRAMRVEVQREANASRGRFSLVRFQRPCA